MTIVIHIEFKKNIEKKLGKEWKKQTNKEDHQFMRGEEKRVRILYMTFVCLNQVWISVESFGHVTPSGLTANI